MKYSIKTTLKSGYHAQPLKNMAEDIKLGTWIYQPDAAFRRWIEQLDEKGFAPNSTKLYKAMFGSFRRYMKECRPPQTVLTISASHIKSFLDSLGLHLTLGEINEACKRTSGRQRLPRTSARPWPR
jgi:hypothetical protein